MKDTSITNNIKRGRGRPRKVVSVSDSSEATTEKTVGLPVMLEPNEHDIRDELSYFDSYVYSRYNE